MCIPKKISIIAMSLTLVFVILVATIFVINIYKSNKQKTQDEYINSYLKEVGNQKLDNIDAFYYELLKDNYFAIFNKEADRKEREKIYYYSLHQNEAILEICKQPPNLYGIVSLYDIDKEKGLLNCESYDKIYYDKETLAEDNFRRIITETDKKKDIYLISLTQDPYVLRVGAKKIEEIDKFGNIKDIREKRIFDEKNTEYNFKDLCLDGEKMDYAGWYGEYYGEDIAISKHFREKYGNFLNLFIHYSPIEYNHITLTDLDIENQKAVFEVDSILECKKRTYEVKYILDDSKYIYDTEVKLISEEKYSGNSNNRENKLFYMNSNWDNLELTDNFLNKFNGRISVFPDIEMVSFSFDWEPNYYKFIAIKGIGRIESYRFADNSIHYYYYKANYSGNLLNDLIYEKLPYNSSMTLEEVRDAYIRDYVEKK